MLFQKSPCLGYSRLLSFLVLSRQDTGIRPRALLRGYHSSSLDCSEVIYDHLCVRIGLSADLTFVCLFSARKLLYWTWVLFAWLSLDVISLRRSFSYTYIYIYHLRRSQGSRSLEIRIKHIQFSGRAKWSMSS